MSNASDFIIENGVLKKYVGPGGDVVIPDGVTEIGEKAFWMCCNLVRIVIPDSVTNIGPRAFEYCELLQDIKLSTNIDKIDIYTFNNCSALSSIQIPNGVTKILWNAFSYCTSLSHITIPDSVACIDDYAFVGCESLRINITNISLLPSKIRKNAAICFLEDGGDSSDPRSNTHFKFIKTNALKMMDQIVGNAEMLAVMHRENLFTPKSALAFLEAVQTTGNADAIALMLDYNSNKLASSAKQQVEKQKEVMENTVFDRRVMRQEKVGIDGLSFVVTGVVETFENRAELKNYIQSKGGTVLSAISAKVDFLIMNDDSADTEKRKKAEELGIEIITEQQLNEKAGREFWISKNVLRRYVGSGGAVVVPNTVKEIDGFAFVGCSQITSITLPAAVQNISGDMFCGCTGLADENGFIIIGDTVYGYTGEATSVTLPDVVTKIGRKAFAGCAQLRSAIIPDSVIKIEPFAFSGCEALVELIIPDTVNDIGEAAFANCTALTQIVLPDSIVKINPSLFSGSKNLESVNIPDSIHTIDAFAFKGCKKLSMIHIPNSAIVINSQAFFGCTALASVYITASTVQIGKDAFSGCKKMTIYAPAGSYANTFARVNKIPFVAE